MKITIGGREFNVDPEKGETLEEFENKVSSEEYIYFVSYQSLEGKRAYVGSIEARTDRAIDSYNQILDISDSIMNMKKLPSKSVVITNYKLLTTNFISRPIACTEKDEK
jgi:hypothetical protein